MLRIFNAKQTFIPSFDHITQKVFFDLPRELKRKLFSHKKECVMTDSICNENARKCRTT